MRTLPLLAATAFFLLTPSASAEVFVRNTGFVHLDLVRGSQSSPDDADLHVSVNGVWARSGLRRAGRREDFHQLEPSVLNQAYDVQDKLGGKWRLWIRFAAGRTVEIELVRQKP